MPTTPINLEQRRQASGLDEAVAVFAALRPRLHALATQVLHDRAEAEDIVQDAWLRWQTCDRAAVRNPTAFLVTMTRRLAMNARSSARARREYSVGDWINEPTDSGDDPAVGPERNEDLDFCIRLVTEQLSPTERAAFVLRHALDYPYEAIAAVLHLSETNARQVVCRAGKRLRKGELGLASPTDHREIADAFRVAARHGDAAELEQLLAA